MWTDDDARVFAETGLIALRSAFDVAAAERMQAALWGELRQRYGIHRDDPSTWDAHPPTRLVSTKKHRAFEPMLGGDVVVALDRLLGAGRWTRPKHYGQVLVTMPNAATWSLPSRLWHADFDYLAPVDDLFGVKVWALFDRVEPGGGGTPQILGSHRLAQAFVAVRTGDEREYKRVRDGILRVHPYLRALSMPGDHAERVARYMTGDTDVDGVPCRVVELTGDPGDVFITHPWTMHSIAPNASRRPRLMRGFAVYRTEFLAERNAGDRQRSGEGADQLQDAIGVGAGGA